MPRWISLSFCFSAAACGEPLEGGDYFGEALYTISGEVFSSEIVGSTSDNLRITLLWAPNGGGAATANDSAELFTASVVHWSMDIYHPPDSSMLTNAGPDGIAGVLGMPVLYVDDGDGVWDGEEIIGGGMETFVLYLSEDLPEPDGEVPDELQFPVAGYNVVRAPNCESSVPIAPISTNPERVTLVIGSEFTDNLPDTNCDGSLAEWDSICEFGCQ